MFPFTPRHETRVCFEGDGGSGSEAPDGGGGFGHEAGHQAGMDSGSWGSEPAAATGGGGGFESSAPSPGPGAQESSGATPGPIGGTSGGAPAGIGGQESSEPAPVGGGAAPGGGGGGSQAGGAPESGSVGGVGGQAGVQAGEQGSTASGAQAGGFSVGASAAGFGGVTAAGYSPSFTDVIEAFGPPVGPSFAEDEDKAIDTFEQEAIHNMPELPTSLHELQHDDMGPVSDEDVDPLGAGRLPAGTTVAQSRALARPIDTNVPAAPMRPGDAFNRATSILSSIFGMAMSSAPGPVGAFLQGRPLGAAGAITGPWQAAMGPLNSILGLGRMAGVVGQDDERSAMRTPGTGPAGRLNAAGWFSAPPDTLPELGFAGRPTVTGTMLGFHSDRLPVGVTPDLDPTTYDIGSTPAAIAEAIAAGAFAPGAGAVDASGGYSGGPSGAMGGGGEGGNEAVNAMLTALGLSPVSEEQAGSGGGGETPSGQLPTTEQLPELLQLMLRGAGMGFFEDLERQPTAFRNISRRLWAA